MSAGIETEGIEIFELEDYNASKHEKHIVERYEKAIMNKDEEELKFIRSMGDGIRARIMNIHDLECAKLFGYSKIEFDKNGWLVKEKWVHEEEIHFLANDAKAKENKITLAQGANGKWTWGYSYSFGAGAGGGGGANFHGDIFETRAEALKDALLFFHERFIQARGTDDSTNYNQKVVADMLKAIKTHMLLNDVTPLAQEEPTFEMQPIKNKSFTASPQLALFGGTQLSF